MSRQMYSLPFALYPTQPSSATLQNAPGMIAPACVGSPPRGGGGGAASVVGGGGGGAGASVVSGGGAGASVEGVAEGVADGVVGDADGATALITPTVAVDWGAGFPDPPLRAAIPTPPKQSTTNVVMMPSWDLSDPHLAGSLHRVGSALRLAYVVEDRAEGEQGAVYLGRIRSERVKDPCAYRPE
jgi:hypothetical protein